MIRPVRDLVVRKLLPPVALQAYRGLARSWRYVVHHGHHLTDPPRHGQQIIGSFLHARCFQMLHFFSLPERGPYILMCSPSRDGDAMAYLQHKLGFRVARGSSGTGGAKGLVTMIKALREQQTLNAALSVDGSRGPRGVAQAGALLLAQKVGGVVVPFASSARHCWVYARSWDRTAMPKPFSEVHVGFGAPIAVPRGIDDAHMEALRLQLEQSMLAVHAELDQLSGFRDSEPLQAPQRAQ